MQIKTELVLTFKNIPAESYEDAQQQAFDEMHWWLKATMKVDTFEAFKAAVKTFKEADNSFTVVLP